MRLLYAESGAGDEQTRDAGGHLSREQLHHE